MRYSILFTVLISLGFSQLSFAAACPASSGTITAGNGTSCDVTDAGTSTVITLNFNSGFESTTLIENDTAAPTATDTYLSTASGKTVSSATAIAASTAAASIASGNNGTTVGAQRKISFIKAAEIIASQINTTEPVVIDADFSALSCNSSGATLGSAGASNNLAYGDPAAAGYLPNTYYPIGLFNSIAGSDADAGLSDVTADFNTNTGATNCLDISNGWYYGFDTPPSVVYTDENGDSLNLVDGNGDPLAISYIGFTTVLLHEITHGLGFASGASASTGVKGFDTGKDDIYSNNLYDNANSRNWNHASETDGQRAASAISSTGLLWTGTNVNTQAIGVITAGFQENDASGSFTSGDRMQMYAPSPVEGGSSVSHFDTAASPNELMEPQYTEGSLSLGLALYLLKDIGWSITAPNANNAPTITIAGTPYSTNEDTAKVINASSWDADADGDTVTFSVSSCPANITCAIDSDGQNLTLTPDSNYNGATNSVEITVTDDGTGTLSASDTFNLTVTAVNDTPSITAIDQSTSANTALTINISSWGADIDGDTLTYTTSCPANITCSNNPSGTSFTMTPDANYSGATNTITVTVTDNGTGNLSASDTFNLNVSAAANNSPTITAVDQATTENSALVIDISSWGTDIDGDTLTYTTSCPANITCLNNPSGTSFTMTPDANYSGASNTVTVTVTDSGAGNLSASDTFNLNVSAAANNAPSITAIDQTTNENTALVIDISNWGADIDGDSLTYTTSCPANITCSNNPSGTSFTMTPDAGFSGTSNTITVTVTDNGAGNLFASDTFNLTINTANTAPSWSTIPTQSHTVGDIATINLNTFATDSDGDTMTYTGCEATSICSITANTLTINTTLVTTENILITADDGNGGTANSASFSITINAVANTLSATFNSSTFEDGDSLDYGLENADISIIGGTGAYSFDLSYDGSDGSALLNSSTASVSINLPETGAFAGVYTLTVTDNGNNETMALSLIRPMRLTWSTTSILNGDAGQTLSIEGGAAGSLYTVAPSGDLSFIDDNGTAITTFTAPDNTAKFNAATGFIVGTTVTTITGVTATVSNSNNAYDDVDQDIKLYPSLAQQINVVDSDGSSIAGATVTLASSTLLTELNLVTSYTANAQGQVSLLLPDDDNGYAMTISAANYNPQTLTVSASQTAYVVTLTDIENAITLSGSISALGTQDFQQNPPALTLLLANGDVQAITVVVTNSSQASFSHDVDINNFALQTLKIEQANSLTINQDISSTTQSQTFNILLERNAAVVVISSGGGGGSPNPMYLFLLSLLLWLKPRSKNL